MNVKKLKKNKKGFTLVEIIVVLVIIGILMALAVPAVMKYVGEAAATKEQSQVRAGYFAAQTVAASEVGKNPGIKGDELSKKIDVATVNTELGLEDTEEGKVENIACPIEADKQKVSTCYIKIENSDTVYKATRTEIVSDTYDFEKE